MKSVIYGWCALVAGTIVGAIMGVQAVQTLEQAALVRQLKLPFAPQLTVAGCAALGTFGGALIWWAIRTSVRADQRATNLYASGRQTHDDGHDAEADTTTIAPPKVPTGTNAQLGSLTLKLALGAWLGLAVASNRWDGMLAKMAQQKSGAVILIIFVSIQLVAFLGGLRAWRTTTGTLAIVVSAPAIILFMLVLPWTIPEVFGR
jgi:hypothetical protein